MLKGSCISLTNVCIEPIMEGDSSLTCLKDVFASTNDDICLFSTLYSSEAFDLRRKLFRSSLKEPKKEETSALENSPQRQAVVNCFNSLRAMGLSQVQSLTAFFERLVLTENEKNPVTYGLLLDLYNQCISLNDSKKERLVDFDMQQNIRRLWDRIRKNGPDCLVG